MVRDILFNLISLLFPACCGACSKGLNLQETGICTHCLFELPYTDFHLYDENPVARQFWGRVKIEAAMAMLYYKKAGKVQRLIHNLKYRQKTHLGVWLGASLGKCLIESEHFKKITIIIPVPLHKKKFRQRGYNQSEFIASGISEALKIRYTAKSLIRTIPTETQTQKSRFNRHENMKDVFFVQKKAEIVDQHILLVDDVLTTGATLEACAITLLEAGAKTISIATIAYAQ